MTNETKKSKLGAIKAALSAARHSIEALGDERNAKDLKMEADLWTMWFKYDERLRAMAETDSDDR